ncbi:MAG: glycerophosphodiester phosphodiesterase family protein [Pirellulaceae bacterium]|jgi:glycerophosphoryl diester phosphodiesterase|nr:glycerophosphodiester phosphodiesterase family protein [Pirellulaceae bacterium]MDP7015895.1 glycerophosphodiester phosphodiesterase family protein [Pirellulaceae bacterium]
MGRKIIALATVCILASNVAATADDLASAAKNVRQIIAHRGASHERPECTIVSLQRAIEVKATAVEVDVRTSKDGVLFILHDTTLDRTTNGKGKASLLTVDELKRLDAGAWFDKKYQNERIPTLQEVLVAAKGKIDVLLDLKEQGDRYDRQVVKLVREFGEPRRTIVGVRSVEQARRFRKLLPDAQQLGLIPTSNDIEAFRTAGVETIRLWPRWIESQGVSLVRRVRKSGAQLHLNGSTGELDEIQPLLLHSPESMSADDPRTLIANLKKLKRR